MKVRLKYRKKIILPLLFLASLPIVTNAAEEEEELKSSADAGNNKITERLDRFYLASSLLEPSIRGRDYRLHFLSLAKKYRSDVKYLQGFRPNDGYQDSELKIYDLAGVRIDDLTRIEELADHYADYITHDYLKTRVDTFIGGRMGAPGRSDSYYNSGEPSPLFCASFEGNPELTESLIRQGWNVNSNYENKTTLIVAVRGFLHNVFFSSL